MYQTRLASAADFAEIAEFQLRTWTAQFPEIASQLDLTKMTNTWRASLTGDSQLGQVVVCESQGKIIGLGAIARGNREWELTLLEVDVSLRRKTIGSRLLNALADLVEQSADPDMYAWAPADNLGLCNLLESTGWRATKAQRTVQTLDGTSEISQLQYHVTAGKPHVNT